MKKNKLILMMIVAVGFCLTLNVKAIDITTDSTKQGTVDTNSYLVTNKGTIIVTNLPDPTTIYTDGKDLIAVKIIDVFYNSTSNEITYEFTSNFQKFLSKNSTYKNLTVEDYFKLTSGDITSGSPITSSTLDQLINKYNYSNSDATSSCKVSSEECKFTDLPVGAYVIRPYNSFDRAFAEMVGNIVPTASNNTWTIQGTTIVAKTTLPFIFNAYIGKVGNKVGTFTQNLPLKVILTVDYTNYPKNTNEDTELYLTVMPELGKTLLFGLNRLGKNCVYDNPFCATLQIKDGTEYLNLPVLDNVDAGESEIKNSSGEQVGFVNNQFQTVRLNLNKLKSNKITYEYTLTNEENLNNGLYIDRFSENNEYEFSLGTSGLNLSSSITLYSYDLKTLTYEKDNRSKTLSGITFDVYSDEAMTNKVDTITTGSNGTATVKYIGGGTFYLKQTKTSSGYTIVKPFSITIDSTNTEPFGTYTVEVPIPKAGLLPVTGGIGTIIYTAIGLSVIISAVTVYTIYRKKNKVQELSN